MSDKGKTVAEFQLENDRTAVVKETKSGFEVHETRERTALENMAQALTFGVAALGQESLDKKVASFHHKSDAINHASHMK